MDIVDNRTKDDFLYWDEFADTWGIQPNDVLEFVGTNVLKTLYLVVDENQLYDITHGVLKAREAHTKWNGKWRRVEAELVLK